MLGLRFPKPWLIHKPAFYSLDEKREIAVWSLHIVLILCPSLERWLPGTLPVYFSFLFCLIDNVSRIFTIAQRCRGTQASGNLLERFKFLTLGKKNMVSGFSFPSLFSSNCFSIFDTFVLHLLPNQIFSTFFPTICYFWLPGEKKEFFFVFF